MPKLKEILELLRCEIINIIDDPAIDLTEELKRQRETISTALLAIKKELEACVPDMKQHSKNDPVCDISRDIGFNSCRTQTLTRIKEI